MSHQSSIWAGVVDTLTRTLPTIFDRYENPIDAQTYLIACVEPPISSDFISLIAQSYKRDIYLLKGNFTQFLTAIENLIKLNNIKEARKFVIVINEHFKAVDDIKGVLEMLIRVCSSININHRNDLCEEICSPIVPQLSDRKCNKNLASLFFDLALHIFDLCVLKSPIYAERLLSKTELLSRCTDLVRFCVEYEKFDIKSHFSDLDSLADIIRIIVERSKIYTIIYQSTHDQALQTILHWSGLTNIDNTKVWSRHICRIGELLIKLIDQQKITANICSQFIQALHKRVIDNEQDDNQAMNNSGMRSFFISIDIELATYIEHLKTLPYEVHCQLAALIIVTRSCPIQHGNGINTFEHTIVSQIWYRIGPCLNNHKDVRVYEKCLKKLYSLGCDDGQIVFYSWWSIFWNNVGIKLPDTAADFVQDFLHDALDRKQISVASLLPLLYNKRSEMYHARLNDMIDVMFDGDISYVSLLGHLFWIIIKEHPKLITLDQLEHIFTSLKNYTDAGHEFHMIFQGLTFIANINPNLFHKYRSILLHFVIEKHNLSAYNCLQQYLVASTIVNGEQTANESLVILINLLKDQSGITNDIRTQIFHTCQLIGIINKQALQTKRSDLIKYNSYNQCRTLIDFIDGNKLTEENQILINQTKEEILQIEKRVGKTEKNLQNVKIIVKQHELKVTNLNEQINVVDTHLNDVNQQIEIQRKEIERIDAKTLSYVPSEWGNEVSKLLNIKSDNDWRLLGKRFGYSTSELKHWALQSDPSMYLLNEWFMTHKADEATYGLVKILEEIGRQDVVNIIRNAVITAGELIPDDMNIEIKRLPPVFLSYQWGYLCWMDTGQIGGGDKLFAKIDAGIRGAKVIICCMNIDYAQSDNCLRKVYLCISTGKSLIPLQTEKQTWPPEGALGPIMREYLFIRFYDKKTNSDNYWPVDKFIEFLGQIHYYVAPDPDMITKEYYNWFSTKY
ncbi:unnamed protein product [Rotaria sp. Silwood2]|nr:unnamed protein product [Rotaria sp. Silwood2]